MTKPVKRFAILYTYTATESGMTDEYVSDKCYSTRFAAGCALTDAVYIRRTESLRGEIVEIAMEPNNKPRFLFIFLIVDKHKGSSKVAFLRVEANRERDARKVIH